MCELAREIRSLPLPPSSFNGEAETTASMARQPTNEPIMLGRIPMPSDSKSRGAKIKRSRLRKRLTYVNEASVWYAAIECRPSAGSQSYSRIFVQRIVCSHAILAHYGQGIW